MKEEREKKIRIEQEKTGENTVKLGRIVRKTGSRGKGEKQNRKINEKEKKRYKERDRMRGGGGSKDAKKKKG